MRKVAAFFKYCMFTARCRWLRCISDTRQRNFSFTSPASIRLRRSKPRLEESLRFCHFFKFFRQIGGKFFPGKIREWLVQCPGHDKFPGMEKLGRDSVGFFKLFIDRRAAIFMIPCDGMSEGSQMGADLVGSSCQKLYFQQSKSSILLQGNIAGCNRGTSRHLTLKDSHPVGWC